MEEFFTNIMEHHSYLAYVILFIWSMAEGETGLVLAGILAYTGHILLLPAIIVAGFGGAAGDLLFFHLGKYHTDVVRDKIKNNEVIIDEIKDLLKKHDIIVIFVQRYLYGLRTIIPIVIGMTKYDEKRFFMINLISALIWASMTILLAYHFGEEILGLFEKVKDYWYIFVILYLIFFFIFGKRIKKRLVEFEMKKIDEINKE